MVPTIEQNCPFWLIAPNSLTNQAVKLSMAALLLYPIIL